MTGVGITERVVDPAGFLKVSAVGVEDQRVNVIADFTDLLERRKPLGAAGRVEARIVISERDAPKVPSGGAVPPGERATPCGTAGPGSPR